MHTKMQDNLKWWFKQREIDNKQVKRPKISSEVLMPSNFKLTTVSNEETKLSIKILISHLNKIQRQEIVIST